MIGLDIKVKNEYNNYLYKIFNGIRLSNYVWHINFNDFLYFKNEDRREDFFDTDVMNGEEFFKCISRDSYYMIFVDIKAYSVGNKAIKVETFDDFIRSNCKLVLLCTDSIFIEFYCKDRDILNAVYNNCMGEEFEEVLYKTIEEVSGRSLNAW